MLPQPPANRPPSQGGASPGRESADPLVRNASLVGAGCRDVEVLASHAVVFPPEGCARLRMSRHGVCKWR